MLGGGRVMSERVFDKDQLETLISFREQDDEFCRMLRAAIEQGAETYPIGVSREPGTKSPVSKLWAAKLKRPNSTRTAPIPAELGFLCPRCLVMAAFARAVFLASAANELAADH